MNKRTQRMLSLALAFMMMLAFAAPVMATELPKTTNVVVHKILMTEDAFNAHVMDKEYDPSVGIQDISGFFGTGSKPINGVAFDFYKVADDYVMPDPFVLPTGIEPVQFISGQTETFSLVDGKWLMVENHADSTYVGDDGKSVLTDMKAVPQVITLPLENQNGRIETVHLYPKNTEDKPNVTKTHDEAQAELQMKKDAMIGQELPYIITTTIPAEAKYATATWTDPMTEGLTLVPTSITVEGAGLVAGDYTITSDVAAGTFSVVLGPTGLEKINNKATAQTITIKYTAILNDLAVVEVPEANDVFFHYGNTPDHGNTPIPTKPDTGKITVKKSFEEGTTPPAEIVVALVDAQTGLEIERQTLTAANGWTYVWTGLDNELEYKVVEITTGYVVTYGVESLGIITLANKESTNPPPINPDEPTVTTYGKKFVKTDNEDVDPERLIGAEFVVTNAAGKYLALKEGTQDLAAYQAAKAAYDTAIAAVNTALAKGEISADNPVSFGGNTYTTQVAAEAAIANLYTTLENTFVAAQMQWRWADTKEEAYVFVSGPNGQFEVTGLAPGTYNLVEIKAPVGYVLNEAPRPFEVGPGSYTTGNIPYELEGTTDDAQQVKNTKVTIPQTGGIGTIIFGAIGLTLMGGAVVAFKKRESEEE